jgi:signal transduction histidine kinase
MALDLKKRVNARRIAIVASRLRLSCLALFFAIPLSWGVRAIVGAPCLAPPIFPTLIAALCGVTFIAASLHRFRSRTPAIVFTFCIGLTLLTGGQAPFIGPEAVPLLSGIAALILPAFSAMLPLGWAFNLCLSATYCSVFAFCFVLTPSLTSATEPAAISLSHAAHLTNAWYMLSLTFVVSSLIAVTQDRYSHREMAAKIRLRQLNRERNRAVRARDEVIANLSHDMRNPLAVATGYAAMVSDDDLPTEDRGHALARLQSSLWQLVCMTENLLISSADEAGALALTPEAVPLGPVFEELAGATAILAQGKPITVKTEVSPGVVVLADRQRLIRTLNNLVGNAVKYTTRGEIRLVVREGGGSAIMEIHDTGIGIPASQLSTIFQRYNQVKDEGRDGVGLGLAIAKLLAERMGGTLEVESKERVGSCFTLRLPALAAPRVETTDARAA